MSPELIAACGAVAVAVVTAGPAYLAARKSGRTAADEGTATRDAVAALSVRLDADGRARDRENAETRADLRALREDVSRVREWQAAHDAEHVAMRHGGR
ncbi:hypothetical protein [Nocardiopsis alba]|uniref:hypothetical protein n=1 Tax=Nocardiopsis alba TaxID=53437 RepID=UPI003D75BDBB